MLKIPVKLLRQLSRSTTSVNTEAFIQTADISSVYCIQKTRVILHRHAYQTLVLTTDRFVN